MAYVTCCEEQEAHAAELRSMRRDATELQEARLLFRGLERTNMLRSGRLEATLTEPCELADREGPEGKADDDDGDEDFAALRAKRMHALRDRAAKEAERKAHGFGTYCILADDASFAQLRGRHVSVVHLCEAGDELSNAVDSYLARVAPEYARFKLYRAGTHELLLEHIGRAGPPPILVALKAGALVDVLDPSSDDCDDLIEAVACWLHVLRERFANAAGSDDDDETTAASYCGKKGCGRTFPHEHVEWKAQARSSDEEPASDPGTDADD
ncbi:hypothetical protein KFE25_009999 [Diacronema lutheri]|uniref:Phosducin thioredoxin-like domain-containing protein n=1 Tax=Diacronema lutheri TaxID=2081491 RepID=A0A8J6CB05_DIALT|nr:hypothetical protein KFE25_009999 [Diacronema lutheri]